MVTPTSAGLMAVVTAEALFLRSGSSSDESMMAVVSTVPVAESETAAEIFRRRTSPKGRTGQGGAGTCGGADDRAHAV